MPHSDVDPVALREACAASLYGFDSRHRRDDAFEETLTAVCDWAVTLDRYDAASLDVFTGDGVLTVAGRPSSPARSAAVEAAVTGEPGRAFHHGTSTGSAPAWAWAGATLLTPHGAVLGCLTLWADAPVSPAASTRVRLPLLARSAMHLLDGRQRLLSRRAVRAPGPRPLVERRQPSSG